MNNDLILPIPVIVVSNEYFTQYRLKAVLEHIGYKLEDIYFSTNFVDAKQILELNSASFAIVDISTDLDGSIDFIKNLKKFDPSIMILAIACAHHKTDMLKALCAGATGYCLKEQNEEEIFNSTRITIQGGAQIDAFIAEQIMEYFNASNQIESLNKKIQLDVRDQQILSWVISGLNTQEIAQKLRVSKFSIESFIKLIYQKIHL